MSITYLKTNEDLDEDVHPYLPIGWRGVIMLKCLTQEQNTLYTMGFEHTSFVLSIRYFSAEQ